ncbi:organic cation transporter protein-like isoform X2 [Lampetra fluviatilis]
MNFDDVLKKIGGFGKFQVILYTWICLPHISIAMHMLVSVFAGATPEHFCRDPTGGHAQVPSATTTTAATTTTTAATTTTTPAAESAAANGTASRPRCGSLLNESEWRSCATGWDYDRSVFTSTVVTEWDLVCTRSYLNNVGSSIFMLGLMVGSPVLGTMADKYGRKSVILVSMAIQTAFGLGAAFAPNFMMYALARFMVGVAISGVIMNAFVLATEWTGIGERMLAGIATQQAFGVGYMLLAPVAYFIRDWRHLQLAISIPEILFIAYIWLLPRSARWLLANNHHDKAESLVRRAAAINGMSLPDDLLKSEMLKQKLTASPQQAHSVLDLFRTPRLRKQSFILFYSWFAITLVYYGLSLGISDLGLDIFLTQFIFGAVEIPARFLLLVTLPKSRRMSQTCPPFGPRSRCSGSSASRLPSLSSSSTRQRSTRRSSDGRGDVVDVRALRRSARPPREPRLPPGPRGPDGDVRGDVPARRRARTRAARDGQPPAARLHRRHREEG